MIDYDDVTFVRPYFAFASPSHSVDKSVLLCLPQTAYTHMQTDIA
jgi:hypothetical protein